MKPSARLAKLESKARADGKYAVSAAAFDLAHDTSCLDRQINLIGAMHEAAFLQNSLAPYWEAFRADESAWIARCLQRLLSSDSDYWAVASLLGCRHSNILTRAKRMGFQTAAKWRYSRFDKPDVHVHTLFQGNTGSVLRPLMEVGCDPESGIAMDIMRARALALDDEDWKPGKPLRGSCSYFMRASLPYGVWRMHHSDFEIEESALLKR